MNPWLHTIINTWWVIYILLLTNSWQLKEHIEQNPSTINWGRVTLPYPSLCKTLRAMFYIILFIYLFLKTLITERIKFTFLVDYQG